MPTLLLASRSPRRRAILKFAGIAFRAVKPLGVSERPRKDEKPRQLVKRLAVEKALSISRKNPSALVLGADTVVVCRGRVFGKPRGRMEAAKMLGRLEGRVHTVMTGIALVGKGGKFIKSRVEVAKVHFKRIDEALLHAYLRTREPYDKAGGYDIRGTARKWVEKWKGDYFTIVGLPLRWLLVEVNRFEKNG